MSQCEVTKKNHDFERVQCLGEAKYKACPRHGRHAKLMCTVCYVHHVCNLKWQPMGVYSPEAKSVRNS